MPLDLGLGHIEFFVTDIAATGADLVARYGFQPVGWAGSRGAEGDSYSLALRQGAISLVLTRGLSQDHPASRYVLAHGNGVADIALTTGDVPAAVREATRAGGRVVAGPDTLADGSVTATISGFGDVTHTLVQRSADTPDGLPPGFTPVPDLQDQPRTHLLNALDHLAVCLEPGQLEPTVRFYETVLGFTTIFTEHIAVGRQAMNSKVVRSAAGEVVLTLIEPDTSAAPGQIDEFLRDHGGPGVQHLAFRTDDVVGAVGTLREAGVRFLSTPDAYYDLMRGRLELVAHDVEQLRDLNVLADEDHDGQLFQIFTRSTHPRGTLFFEVIERCGARTFGSGNIKALYEAVEAERLRAQGTPA
ncbi:4-hydroxyphenylpyruvate dioxygenase [Wenjunlia vitaminophila]|uniref:4-hydroxyphenylpyruvate dioxygenase n=1 Tax=Wenjunlia vitaminophila TaxID=76728 RepID=A0A0T6LXK1_WENVI|nr:4-hydroxyphenylpyruvate dioxygenase [Wenjunlia vitaminophila]KRV50476.1 4-hydroxyphenylpyruvate dioxygenase [Wenjunlia vitaminophila]